MLASDKSSDLSKNEEDCVVSEAHLQQVQELLCHRTADKLLHTTQPTKSRENQRAKQAKSKGVKRPPPILKGKNNYLHFVGAIDCIKAYKNWKMSFVGVERS